MREPKICSSCMSIIQSASYVISQKENEEKYTHVYCFYPNLLKNYKKITKSYVYQAMNELNLIEIEKDLRNLTILPIDFLLQNNELDYNDEYAQDEQDDEIDDDLPSAA